MDTRKCIISFVKEHLSTSRQIQSDGRIYFAESKEINHNTKIFYVLRSEGGPGLTIRMWELIRKFFPISGKDIKLLNISDEVKEFVKTLL